jgi:hypothetical protein
MVLLASDPPFYKRVYDGRIGESRGIPEVFQLVMGDLPQDAPHNLAASRFRQTGSELELVG